MKRITNKLVKFLQKQNLTIAFAESMSCGLLTHQLNKVKGTSDVLKGSIICYSEDVKTGVLNVPKLLIKKHTAESQLVTDSLAKNLRSIIRADVCAAITGLAASGGSECASKPVGTVFYSIFFDRRIFKEKNTFRGTSLEIKKKACENFYKFIYKTIESSL